MASSPKALAVITIWDRTKSNSCLDVVRTTEVSAQSVTSVTHGILSKEAEGHTVLRGKLVIDC